MRWVLLASTIPIAIAANAARVTLMGLIGEYRVDLARGFLHLAEGWVLFVIALALVVHAAPMPAKILTALLILQGALFYGLSRGEPAVLAPPVERIPVASSANGECCAKTRWTKKSEETSCAPTTT